MKFKTKAKMHSTPDFNVDATLDPIGFTTSAKGSFTGKISSISADVGEIPIRLAIPFLKRKDNLPLVVTIGGFIIKLNPLSVKIENANVQLDGILGTKGIKGKMDSKVLCNTEMDMTSVLSGKVGSFTVNLDEEDFEED